MRDRRWTFFLGVILLMNAAFILMRSDGRIEGYVSSAVCTIGGIVNVAFAFRAPARDEEQDGPDARREPSGE